jgi:hypothetical protein
MVKNLYLNKIVYLYPVVKAPKLIINNLHKLNFVNKHQAFILQIIVLVHQVKICFVV